MANTVIGVLTIDLRSNTSSFTASMEKAAALSGKTANDVKRSLERITAAGIAMGTALAGGTAALIKNALDSADRLDELAQQAGTTTEKLSALSYAAKFSSISTEELSGALVKLSKSAFAAQNGNEELQKVFKRLGVSVTDGNGHLKDSGDLLLEVAPKFAAVSDGAGKTALALQILGKSGAASIPVLNQLGESGAALSEEAKRLGLVISTDTAKAAADINDNLDRLKATFKGVGLSIVSETLPALKDLTERLLNLAKGADLPDIGKAFGQKVSAAIHDVGDALEFGKKHAEGLKIAIEALLALQFAKFTIPFLAELSSASLAAGVGKFITSVLGLSRLYPILSKLATGFTATAAELLFFVRYEGLATTATYAFGSALTFLAANPVLVAGTALVGLAAILYKLKTANDSAREAADNHRKSLLAAGQIRVPDELKGVKLTDPAPSRASQISSLLAFKPPAERAKTLPSPDTSGLGKKEKDAYDEELKRLKLAIAAQEEYLSVVGATPEAIARVASAERAEGIILELNTKRRDADKGNLSAQQEATIRAKVAAEDSLKALVEYGRAIADQTQNADLAAVQQARLTAAVFAGEDATRKATVDNTILGLTFGKTAEQIAAMKIGLEDLRNALLKKEDLESFGALAKTIYDQQRSTALATQQLENLSAAESRGQAAVRDAAVANTILGLTYDKNADQIKRLQPEIDKLSESLRKKAAADRLDSANKDVLDLGNEISARSGLPAAILAGEDAYRKATLAARLFNLEQEITAESDDKVRSALEKKRDLTIQLTRAETAEADARDALSLKSVADKYDEDTAKLNRHIAALTEGGKRNLTYGESLQVAAREQDNLNKAIDDQISLLTRFGGAKDGVTAFFLQMQKDAKSTAAIVFDALNSAFDKISDNFAKLITGQKTEFGKALQDIGQQIVGDTVKQQLEHALKPIGKAFGVDLSIGKADGSKDHPFYVIGATGGPASVASGGGSKDIGELIGDKIAKAIGGKLTDPSGGGLIFHARPGSAGIGPGAGTNLFGKPDGTRGNPFYVISLNPAPTQAAAAAKAPGILSQILGPLLGAGIGAAVGGIGKSGGGESVTSSISFPEFTSRTVSPQAAYLTDQIGTSVLSAPSASIEKNFSSRAQSGTAASGITYNVSVDARGTDPVLVEDRTRRGVLAAHNSAVTTAIQATVEFQKRTPQRV